MDYYSILGIPKNASDQDIRKAYKKMSMQHHPDRGGDEEQFKKINEAYSTLKDPQKRAAYDNPQPQWRFNSEDVGPGFGGFHQGHPHFGAFEDIFSGFGFGGPQRQMRKNRDVQLSYKLDIRDTFHGRGVTINYRLPSGKNEILDIRIPPGVKDGDVVRIQGWGDDSVAQLPRGDLLLRIRLSIPKGWDINGLDLITSRHVDIFDLMLGTSVRIDTFDNRTIEVKVPKGSQPGTTFSVNGYGLTDQSGRRGKIYVKILASIPKIEDQDILNKIKDIKTRLAD